jgi:hypothetical protein
VGDYPSVASAPIGPLGTIVIGSNINNCLNVTGFQAFVSTDGGGQWNGPYQITGSVNEAFGRVVASGNTFHYLYIDRSSPPNFFIKHKQSTDGGVTWVDGVPAVVDGPYTMPQPTSPGTYCADPPNCYAVGSIYYSPNIDVAAASGLGWVVAYSAARSDDPTINNLKFCAETLGGCQTISFSNDLFLHGVTTSSSGDLWLSMHTYASDTSRDLPLRQIAIYRRADGTFLNGVVNDPMTSDIDPTSWALFPVVQICNNQRCFVAGDYMRIAMNTVSGATLPYINKSSSGDQTDLMQSFVQDPPTGVSPLAGLQIGPLRPYGSDSTFKGGLSAQEIQRRSTGTHAWVYYLKGGAR